jgi:erythromycin esterase-like protein/predicted phosphoribosyltransferase
MRFRNRIEAGRQLAARLGQYKGRTDVVVLALPRGGVPVASEIARELGAPLDIFLVRKLGVPGHPELAMGAIAEGGVQVLSDDLIAELRIPRAMIDQVAMQERLELERREQLYRDGRTRPDLRNRIVILVDDGLATGSTMEAAVRALRRLEPAKIIVAAPVGASDTCERLRRLADAVVCAETPEPFQAVGLWYEEFTQTTDEEVRELLRAGQERLRPERGAGGERGQAAPPSESERGWGPASSERSRAGQAGQAGQERPRPRRAEDTEIRREASAKARAGGGAPAPLEKRRQPVDLIRQHAIPLTDHARDFDALIEGIGKARLVLLGEASHGTHEFYRARAVITRRLIEEEGFAAVAAEADWPDAYRINRYVRGASSDVEAVDALADFGRFPTWMWRNADVLDFIGWLRAHNDVTPAERRAGFYGIDLYSLRASTQAVLAYLTKVDPAAAARARSRYACFDHFGEEMQQYGYAATFGLTPSCERDVLNQLMDLQRRRADYANRDGRVAADDFFFAEQNARLVSNAEAYYRSMFQGRAASWNLRDRHMADTVGELLTFLERTRGGEQARLVIWAHNSHLGDARATEMGQGGELNVGQLIRERYGSDAVLVGFSTHTGTVTAASEWDAPPDRKHVRPGLAGSYEKLFHEAGGDFLLPVGTRSAAPEVVSALAGPLLERAIGVIYQPQTERRSHYFHAHLPRQFDYVVHFDETRAVEPLERTAGWEAGEMAETFPSGL